jgi:hypothetical protein
MAAVIMLAGVLATVLVVLALVDDGGRTTEPDIIVVQQVRQTSGCLIFGAFLFGILITIVVAVLLTG